MTLADDLDAVWAGAAVIFADSFWSDDYEVWRPTETTDGRGGVTETLTLIGSGKCSLDVSQTQSGERTTDTMVMTVSTYTAELPLTVDLETTDELRINTRAFNVVDIKRGGDWETSTHVQLTQRSA